MYPSSQGTGDLPFKVQNMPNGREGVHVQTLTATSAIVATHRIRETSACHTDHIPKSRSRPFRRPRWPTLRPRLHADHAHTSLGNHAPSHQGQPGPSPPLGWSRSHTLSHSLHPRHTRAPPPEAQERHLLSLTEGRAWGPQHGSSLRNRCFSAFLVGPGGWPGKREDPRREH